jgi:hypothetical protein
MEMNKFRPQDISKRYIMRQRLLTGRCENYNWQSRVEWYPVGYRLNKKTIARQFGRLHYLACHAPKPVQKRWASAYTTFYKKHFGVTGSMRYLNTWTAHAWL